MNHEKLECYQGLMKAAEEIAKKVAKWPRGYHHLNDQITRAMISSVLNLCEGNGKRSSSAERRRFFQISMGSISEVSAGLDLARVFRLIGQNEFESLKSILKCSSYDLICRSNYKVLISSDNRNFIVNFPHLS